MPALSSYSVSSTMITASAPGGMGAPVMMRIASPGPTGDAGRGAGGERGDDGELGRRVGRIGGAHGETIHGRVGERWHGFGRHDIVGKHEAQRVVDGDRHRRACPHPVEDVSAGFFESDHTSERYLSPRRWWSGLTRSLGSVGTLIPRALPIVR